MRKRRRKDERDMTDTFKWINGAVAEDEDLGDIAEGIIDYNMDNRPKGD